MDRIVYDRMAEHDSTHWWYRARRDILPITVARYADLPKDARILEIGCGTGHNLPMLAQFGDGRRDRDRSRRARDRQRSGWASRSATRRCPSCRGSSAARTIWSRCSTWSSMSRTTSRRWRRWRECLKPGGKILITVPAHQWMWSAHDVVNHHHRRYSKATLKAAIDAAGLKPKKLGYFNSLLFPLAAAARVAGRMTGRDDSDDSPPAKPLNTLFEAIFRLERHLVGRVPMPPGVSILSWRCRSAAAYSRR